MQLSKQAVADMKYIIGDDDFMLKLLVDEDRKVSKYIFLNADGSITIGKTSCRWWNKLLGAERTIDFDSFMLRLIDFLSGHQSNRNEIARAGMAQDFINERFGRNNKDELVEMVFTYYRWGYKNGNFHSPEAFQQWISKGSNTQVVDALSNFSAVRDPMGGVAILIPQNMVRR